MRKPESCAKCGAEPQERKRCPRCGEAEWILQHGAHYMQGAREVIGCPCPAFHTALGRRKRAAGEARQRESRRVSVRTARYQLRKWPGRPPKALCKVCGPPGRFAKLAIRHQPLRTAS